MEDRIATGFVNSNDVDISFRTARGNKVVMGGDMPLVLWVDGGSASATEVLAGALHDQFRETIIGSWNIFGKGLIHEMYGLMNGSGFVLTIAKYVMTNGTDIQGSGITPNLETRFPFCIFWAIAQIHPRSVLIRWLICELFVLILASS